MTNEHEEEITEPNVLLVSANRTLNYFICGCKMTGSRDQPLHRHYKKKGSVATLLSDTGENQKRSNTQLYEPKHNQQVIYPAQHPHPSGGIKLLPCE